MTILFWIITAVCFVCWIKAEVQWHICRAAWRNAIEWKDLAEKERDELLETLARVAAAVTIGRTAGDEMTQLQTTLNKRMNEITIPFLNAVIAEYRAAATDEAEE